MNKLNILIAYPYFSQDLQDKLATIPRDAYNLIIDSGAFSAWNSGKEIRLPEYCKFLDSIKRFQPFYAVQLDVFGDPEASYQNFFKMVNAGYKVMPVFTRGESLYRLEEFYKLTDYIMFGGIVTGGKNANYVKWFMNRNKGRKVHWLGFTDLDFIKHYRPTSVDSSSWTGAARFGSIALYEGFGKTRNIKRSDCQTREKMLTLIPKFERSIGLNADEALKLIHDEAWKGWRENPLASGEMRGTAQFYHTMAHIRKVLEIEKNLGTKTYLAVGNMIQIDVIFNSLKELEKRGKV